MKFKGAPIQIDISPKGNVLASDKNGKSNDTYIAAGLALGIGGGVAVGSAMDNVGAGLAIGIAIGIAVGTSLQKRKRSDKDNH